MSLCGGVLIGKVAVRRRGQGQNSCCLTVAATYVCHCDATIAITYSIYMKRKPTVTNTRTEEDDETDQLLITSVGELLGSFTDLVYFQSICFE